MKIPVVLCLLVICVQARVGTKCRADGECDRDQGECCQRLSRFPIMSKRQLVSLDGREEEGTCQMYRTEGDHCGSFEKANGYCGCGPGLRCHGDEVKVGEVQNPPVRRSMIAPRPGYTWVYTCQATPAA